MVRRSLLAVPLLLAAPFAALAQVTIDPGVGSTFGIGTTTDLQQSVINTVNYALGLLGLIAVVTIIASVTIVAARGGSEAADRAKRSLTAAIIGLIVVLLAWAIVTFVVGTTSNVTQ